jgi:hypothetical protein
MAHRRTTDHRKIPRPARARVDRARRTGEFPPVIAAASEGRRDPWSETVEARARHDLTGALLARIANGKIAPSPANLAALQQLHSNEGLRVAVAFRAWRQLARQLAVRAGAPR